MFDAEQQSFLNEISASPRSHAARLIYADWLEDRGDPRGEFIRLQCQRDPAGDHQTERSKACPREQWLLESHFDQWTAPLLKLGIKKWGIVFRWGFVDGLGVLGKIVFDHISEIRRACPLLRRLYIHSADHWIAPLTGCVHLGGLVQLGLRALHADATLSQFLDDTPGLESLRAIDFSHLLVGDDLLSELLGVQALRNVTALDLQSCQITQNGVRSILNSSLAPRLEWLNLYHNYVSDEGGIMLAETKKLTSITDMTLAGNPLSVQILDQLKKRWGDRVKF